MTALPPPLSARNGRALRVVIAPLVASLVVAGLVAVVLLVPRHHRSPAAPSAPSSGAEASSATPESPPESSAPSVLDQLATSPPDRSPASAAYSETALAQNVTRSYLAFEQILYQQLSGTAADVVPLTGVAVGQVLANSEDAVARLRGKGEIQRGEPTFSGVTVTSILSPTMAVVCAVEDDSPTRIVDAKTGTVVASDFPRYATRTTMLLESGVWKASIATSVSAC